MHHRQRDPVRSIVEVGFSIFPLVEVLVLDYVRHRYKAFKKERIMLTIGMSSCPDAIHGYGQVCACASAGVSASILCHYSLCTIFMSEAQLV